MGKIINKEVITTYGDLLEEDIKKLSNESIMKILINNNNLNNYGTFLKVLKDKKCIKDIFKYIIGIKSPRVKRDLNEKSYYDDIIKNNANSGDLYRWAFENKNSIDYNLVIFKLFEKEELDYLYSIAVNLKK